MAVYQRAHQSILAKGDFFLLEILGNCSPLRTRPPPRTCPKAQAHSQPWRGCEAQPPSLSCKIPKLQIVWTLPYIEALPHGQFWNLSKELLPAPRPCCTCPPPPCTHAPLSQRSPRPPQPFLPSSLSLTLKLCYLDSPIIFSDVQAFFFDSHSHCPALLKSTSFDNDPSADRNKKFSIFQYFFETSFLWFSSPIKAMLRLSLIVKALFLDAFKALRRLCNVQDDRPLVLVEAAGICKIHVECWVLNWGAQNHFSCLYVKSSGLLLRCIRSQKRSNELLSDVT